jgi:hypothetical protein
MDKSTIKRIAGIVYEQCMATEYLTSVMERPQLVRVCQDETGEKIYAVFFTEVAETQKCILMHAVLTKSGIALNTKQQCDIYKQYVKMLFDVGYDKVIVKVSHTHRLIVFLTLMVGFVLEGVHRFETSNGANHYYFGLLKKEFEADG